MRKTLQLLTCAIALTSPLAASRTAHAMDAPPAAVQPAQAKKTIEVCFVLDTTGSMSGLIEGAKKKIWAIANGIIAADPKATVRFALLPYRDRGDEYVTKIFELTDDLDKVFADLQSFKADGGGDTPESVNQALAEAVNKVAWTPSADAVKFIFLVGDCPPHMDYDRDVKYPKTCEVAVRKNLIINTVQCGNQSETADIWRDIAKRSEGSYVALQQSGGMVVIDAPQDKEIAELSVKIGALSVPYGSAGQQSEVKTKNASAAAAPAAVSAERATYNAIGGKAIQGRGDLVSDVRDNAVKLEAIDVKELPLEMQKMSPDERKQHLQKQADERDKLTAQVNELAKKRQAYIAEENKKLGDKGDAFDTKVSEMVRTQMQRKR
jgi:Mg-chelatase subunit ChlD